MASSPFPQQISVVLAHSGLLENGLPAQRGAGHATITPAALGGVLPDAQRS
jgi:hypothetical protein